MNRELISRLTAHRRKRISAAVVGDDEALADDVFELLDIDGTYTPDEWNAKLAEVRADRRLIGDVIDSKNQEIR